VSRARVPQRGDIYRVNFDPQLGHEQAGFRPALIVSNSLYNENSSTVVACPITRRSREWPFEVPLPNDLPVTGIVLVDQVKVMDIRARNARFVCAIPDAVLEEVQARLDVLFTGASRP